MPGDTVKAALAISDAQLVGVDASHLLSMDDGHCLHPLAAEAFATLQRDAAAAGFDLAIASSYRSFARQALIWNGKLGGERPVHDDAGAALDILTLPEADRVNAVLRFSALPGASRHHWGTDIDVFDAAALRTGESVRLVPSEVCPGGAFDPLHCWLDRQMASAASQGFFRPYAVDRGGVAPERWHLSFAPLSRYLEARVTPALLRWAWKDEEIGCRSILEKDLPGLLARYVEVPPDWAGSSDRSGT